MCSQATVFVDTDGLEDFVSALSGLPLGFDLVAASLRAQASPPCY